MIENRTRNAKRRRNKNFALAWLKIASELRGLSRIWKWDGVLAGWVCFIPLCAVALGSDTFCTPSLSGAAADRRLLFPSTDIIVANFRDLRWSTELLLLLMVLSTSSELLSKSSAEIISETWAESDSPSATPPSRNSHRWNCQKERLFLGPCLSLLSRTKRFRFRGTAVTVGEGSGRERKKGENQREAHKRRRRRRRRRRGGGGGGHTFTSATRRSWRLWISAAVKNPFLCSGGGNSTAIERRSSSSNRLYNIRAPGRRFRGVHGKLQPTANSQGKWKMSAKTVLHTHRELLSLSLPAKTRSCTHTRSPRSFKNAIQAKYPKCFITHPSSTICSQIHLHPVRFLQDRSSDFRYNLRSCARRLFVSAVCVCVFF